MALFVGSLWPPQVAASASWWYFSMVIGIIIAAAAALVWLPFAVRADWHRYDPPQTRAERRRRTDVALQADDFGVLRRKVLKRQEKFK